MNLQDMLDNLQSSIFKYEVSDVPNSVVSIFTTILQSNIIDPSDSARLVSLNQLMQQCLGAMRTSDYLLLADLLEFQLKPLVGGQQ